MKTRLDVESLLDDLGIIKGATVLLQADSSALKNLTGGMTTLIETVCDRIGPKGCLILPTFTMDALDPASMIHGENRCGLWPMIRQYHPGFSSRTMAADVWKEAASTFLLHTRVKRSEHPVYSFAWLGSVPWKPTLDSLDYPLSYQHILTEMKNSKSINLLIGVDVHHSIYPLLHAHEEGKDITFVQRAFVRRVKKTFEESFLTSRLDEKDHSLYLDQFDVIQKELCGAPVYKIMQKVTREDLFQTEDRYQGMLPL